MQAGDVRLGNVFANDHQNVIPLFQRPYVWSQDENWLPLWLDISKAAEEVEAEHEAPLDGDPRTYFLGAVVIQQRRRAPRRIASSHVIDGQQRLTTLQILLAAARQVAHDLDAHKVAARFSSLLENRPETIHDDHPEDQHKVWPLPQDREAYLSAVRGAGLPLDGHAWHPLVRARVWFERAIGDWAQAAEAPARRLEDLFYTLQERMQLVEITLDPSDDPQVIFEALNHRGVPLDAADLVKNLLFQTLDAQGSHERADRMLLDWWLPLDSRPWRSEVTTGRIKRVLIDLMLGYWLTIRTGREVLVEHLFADFKRWLIESQADAAEIIKDIRKHADTYLTLRSLPETDPTAVLLDHMDATATNTPWPIILYLHSHPEIGDAQREIAARAIDSFLMRRAMCALTTKDYNRLFLQVLITARQADPECAGQAVVDSLAQQSADSRRWPTDDEFAAGLSDGNLFNRTYRVRLKAFLVGLENQLRTQLTEPGSRLHAGEKRLNVEHVLPQKWEKHWPLPDDADDATVERRWGSVHALGNLTLTTTKMNPTLSNKPWAEKRALLKRHSLLRLTQGTILSAPPNAHEDDESWASEWNEDRIQERGAWLSDQAIRAWPRPSNIQPEVQGAAPSAHPEPKRPEHRPETPWTTPRAVPAGRLRVHRMYKGELVEGWFDPSTMALQITSAPWSGKEFTSPSAAGSAVVQFFSPGRDSAVNGRVFWKLANGKELRSLVGQRY